MTKIKNRKEPSRFACPSLPSGSLFNWKRILWRARAVLYNVGKSPAYTTEGHLAQLASANGAVLATLDEGIPGAFLIP